MTSYLKYMRDIKVVKDDDDNIESWITVKGNHIPIKKGQSKEEAVKSFIEKKGGEYKKTVPQKAGTGYYDPLNDDFLTQLYKHKKEEQKKSKYDPEFEVVRKNALANSSLYGGKYTQKSKAEAYKEYKNDTASKENMKKASKFVNGSGSGTPSKDPNDILNLFGQKYSALYKGDIKRDSSLVKEFDKRLKEDEAFRNGVKDFVMKRGDILSSDREVEAYMLALKESEKIAKAKHEEIEKGWQKTLASLEPKTKEEANLWLADTLASTEGFTSANFSKEDRDMLEKLEKKFGDSSKWLESNKQKKNPDTKGSASTSEKPKSSKQKNSITGMKEENGKIEFTRTTYGMNDFDIKADKDGLIINGKPFKVEYDPEYYWKARKGGNAIRTNAKSPVEFAKRLADTEDANLGNLFLESLMSNDTKNKWSADWKKKK